MKVLILSCNTGEGHNCAGLAIEEYVNQQPGHEARMVDIMRLAGKKTSRAVGGAYVGIVKHAPRLFWLLYRAGGLITSARRKSPVYYANTLLAKHVRRYLDETDWDIIVTPHLFAAETLTYMKKKGMLSQKTVAVGTDYTCIPFWEETECDYYVIPHRDLEEEYQRRGIPGEKLRAYGIPVRGDFLKSTDREQARKACRIPKGAHTYLIMSGSMGFGKIQLFVAELLRRCEADEYVIVICGKNRRLERLLRKEFGKRTNIRIVGFTHHVSRYMDACDVLFTKPGGLTSTEGAVKEIPMVHTTPIPGCETKNLKFFVERGISETGKGIRGQVAAGQKLMRDQTARERMRKAQSSQIHKEAARQIFELLTELEGEKGS